MLLLVGCAKKTETPLPQEPLPSQESPAPPSEVEEPEAKTEEPAPELPLSPLQEPSLETEEAPQTHTVNFILKGFSPQELTIRAGDTVKWVNTRSGRLNKAMVVGTITCNYIKSPILETGDSFSWTFNEPQNCTFVDGITTSYLFKLRVE